jgi:hypothetical protein
MTCVNIFCAVFLLCGTAGGFAQEPTGQIPIDRIESLPNLPDDYGNRDWKKVGRDLDTLVYHPNLKGGSYLRRNKFDGEGHRVELFPILFYDESRSHPPGRVRFGIPTFLRDKSKQHGGHYEALTVLPSLIGSSLLGMDKSNQNGVNWVSGALSFLHTFGDRKVFLNNPGEGGGGGDSFWYTVYANVLFSKLYALYPEQPDFEESFLGMAETFFQLTDQLDGTADGKVGIPWGYTQMQGWDFKGWGGNPGNRQEAEASCGAAYILYNAYKETGDGKYLKAADGIMQMLSHPDAENPTYELMTGYGALTMARMNAEEGRDYDLDRMLDWVFAEHSPFRPNWGMIASGEKWYGYNMDGLIGSTVDRGGYAFLCNTSSYLASVLPVAKYDERYARALGKWAVNASSALRYFYRYDENVFPGKNQYMAGWLDENDPNGCLAHDGIIRDDPEFPGRKPHVCSETHNHEGWWSYDSDISMYSSTHIGEVAAMMRFDTGVEGIIQWDLNITDVYGENTFPTFLYYNPHPEQRQITLQAGPVPVDVYDKVFNRILKKKVQGSVEIDLPADAARVLVLIPADSTLAFTENGVLLNGKRLDRHVGVEELYAQDFTLDQGVAVLQDALRQKSIQEWAGSSRERMGSAKNSEIMEAARAGHLTQEDVATYAQSVHHEVLYSIESSLDLPAGFFRAAMRNAQFGEAYGFIDQLPSTLAEKKELQRGIRNTLQLWMDDYRNRGGKDWPMFPMQLTGIAQGPSPAHAWEQNRSLQNLVENISIWELKQRHAYLTQLDQTDISGLSMDSQEIASQPLMNFDHLLNGLGHIRDGKLLVCVYGENVPEGEKLISYRPVYALGEGAYCVDDIARVVVALAREPSLHDQKELSAAFFAGVEFLLAMQAEDGEFYNFASVENDSFMINQTGKTSRKGIGFWSARALWGLAEALQAVGDSHPEISDRIVNALEHTLPQHLRSLKRYGQYRAVDGVDLPAWLLNDAGDQTAILVNGLMAYATALPPGADRERILNLISKFGEGILAAQLQDPAHSEYGRFLNSSHTLGAVHLWGSQQMEVVAKAGKLLNREDFIEAARRCADHYWKQKSYAELCGDDPAEIAYGVGSVLSGFAALYQATDESRYASEAEQWASWFVGNNGAKAVMYDPASGRGYDGLDPVTTAEGIRYTVSANSGAESTVEALLALQALSGIPGATERLKERLLILLPGSSLDHGNEQ